MNHDARWNELRGTKHEIHEHLPFLAGLGHGKDVVEFGFQVGKTAFAFLHGGCRSLTTYDIDECRQAREEMEGRFRDRFRFVQQDSRTVEPVTCDLLFVDSSHDEQQTFEELTRHHAGVRDCIAMHDTDGKWGRAVNAAIDRFLRAQPEWERVLYFPYNHGLTVLRRA